MISEGNRLQMFKTGLGYLSPRWTAKTSDRGCGQRSLSTICGPPVHFQGLVSMVTTSVQSPGLSFSSTPVQLDGRGQVHPLLLFVSLCSSRQTLQLHRQTSQRLSVVCLCESLTRCKACLGLSPCHPLPLLRTGRVYPVGPGDYESNQASFLSLL